MKYCQNCGTENEDLAKFCKNCGVQFPSNSDNVQNNPSNSDNVQNKKNHGCLSIILWIIFLPIMLLIYALKKKKVFWYVITGIVWALVIVLAINFASFYNSPEQVASREQTAIVRYKTGTAKAIINITEENKKALLLQTENANSTSAAETKVIAEKTKNAVNTVIAKTKSVERTIAAAGKTAQAETKNASIELTNTADFIIKETEDLKKTMNAAATLTETFLPSRTPTITQTATITQTPTITKTVTTTPLPWQVTGTALAELAQFKKEYEKIYWKELYTYPDKYIGQKVFVTGQVGKINSDTEFNAYYGGTYYMFYVISKEPFSGIYENNSVGIYGTVEGKYCGSNLLGGTVCPTVINADLIEKY